MLLYLNVNFEVNASTINWKEFELLHIKFEREYQFLLKNLKSLKKIFIAVLSKQIVILVNKLKINRKKVIRFKYFIAFWFKDFSF
jgi:hypothetical protein